MNKAQKENLESLGVNAAGAVIGYAAIKNAPEKIRKYVGPALAIGAVLAQFSGNVYVEELGAGAGIPGLFDTADQWLPDTLKSKAPNMIPALGSTSSGYYLGNTDDDFDHEIENIGFGGEFSGANSIEGFQEEFDDFQYLEGMDEEDGIFEEVY